MNQSLEVWSCVLGCAVLCSAVCIAAIFLAFLHVASWKVSSSISCRLALYFLDSGVSLLCRRGEPGTVACRFLPESAVSSGIHNEKTGRDL